MVQVIARMTKINASERITLGVASLELKKIGRDSPFEVEKKQGDYIFKMKTMIKKCPEKLNINKEYLINIYI